MASTTQGRRVDSYLIGGCLGDLFCQVGGKQGMYNSLHIAVLRSWLITANCVWGGGGGGRGEGEGRRGGGR